MLLEWERRERMARLGGSWPGGVRLGGVRLGG